MEKRKTSILIFVLCVSTFALSAQNTYDEKLAALYKNSVPLINSSELKPLLSTSKNIILLDTRSKEEFDVSHLPNATFLEYDAFNADKVKGIKRNTPIVVYCSVGYRSERIGEKLLKMGFTNVQNLYGGIFEWVNEGNRVVNQSNILTDSVHTYNKNWSQWLVKGTKIY